LTAAEVAQRGERGNALDDRRLRQRRRVTLIGNLDHVDVVMARTHGLDRVARQDVGIGPAHEEPESVVVFYLAGDGGPTSALISDSIGSARSSAFLRWFVNGLNPVFSSISLQIQPFV